MGRFLFKPPLGFAHTSEILRAENNSQCVPGRQEGEGGSLQHDLTTGLDSLMAWASLGGGCKF